MKFAPLSLEDFKRYKIKSAPVKLAYKELSLPKYKDLFSKAAQNSFWKRYIDMNYCANTLFYKEFDDGSNEFDHAIFCQDKFCPLCSEILYRKNLKNLSDVLLKIRQNKAAAFSDSTHHCGASSSIRYVFGTLTVPNCSGLALYDVVLKLSKDWVTLRKRLERLKFPDPDPVSGLYNMFLGFYCVLEVTYKYRIVNGVRNLEFHPHLHFIAAVPSGYSNKRSQWLDSEGKRRVWYPFELSQALLSYMWGEITGNYAKLDLDNVGLVSLYKRMISDLRVDLSKYSPERFPFGVVSIEYFYKTEKHLSRELVKQRKYDLDKTVFDVDEDAIAANYISKGVSKLYYLEMDPLPLGYLSLGLKGVRVFRPSGVFRNEFARLKDVSDDDACRGFTASDPLRHFIILCYIYDFQNKEYVFQDD